MEVSRVLGDVNVEFIEQFSVSKNLAVESLSDLEAALRGKGLEGYNQYRAFIEYSLSQANVTLQALESRVDRETRVLPEQGKNGKGKGLAEVKEKDEFAM